MRSTRLAPLAILALAGAACAPLWGRALPATALGGAGAASTHDVVLKDVRFHPATLTIRRGESVTWLWRDGGIEHNVTFHGFHSRTMAGGSYTVRFGKRGTFDYDCTIHASEGMRGRIIVR